MKKNLLKKHILHSDKNLLNSSFKKCFKKTNFNILDQRFLLKNFLFKKKFFLIKSKFNYFSIIIKKNFKKTLSINFNFKYLYSEYSDKYFIKNFLLEEKIKIFYLNIAKIKCLLIIPNDFFSMCIHIIFGDKNLNSYKKNIYFHSIENNIYIINKIFDIILISFNQFLKENFFVSINYFFFNQVFASNFLKKDNLESYVFLVFQIIYGSIKNIIKICIPKDLLYQIMIKNNKYISGINRKNIKKIWNKKIEHEIKNIKYVLFINLTKNMFSLYFLLNLKIGDIIKIEKPIDVFGFIDNCMVLSGKYGIYNGYRAIRFMFFVNDIEKKIMSKKDGIDFFNKKNNKFIYDKNKKKICNIISEKNFVTDDDKKNNFIIFLKKMKEFMHIPISITINLGKKKISIKELLKLSEGSIIQLDEKDNIPLNIFVNDYLLALGELVIINEKYGIRIIKLLNYIK